MLFGLGVIGVLFALDGNRMELLGSAARRFLPHGPTGLISYRFDPPSGLLRYTEKFREVALDQERSDQERLGAAELYRVCVLLKGDAHVGEEFERHFEVLLDVASDLAHQSAAVALVVDVLRAHRAVLGRLDPDQEMGEKLLVREVLRLARGPAQNNGFFELFASEIALSEGRQAEARDALMRAARLRYTDSLLRQRSASAYTFLRARGLADLEAREFLLDDAYSGQGQGPGELLEELAHRLGALDAGTPELGQDLWMETFLAVHTLGMNLLESALLAVDAEQAVEAENTYLQALGGGRSGDGSPIPRSSAPGLGGQQLRRQLVAAGFTHGAARLAPDREFVREILNPAGAGPGRAGPASDRSGGSDWVIRATAAHALFLPWIAVNLVLFVALLASALKARRARVPIPSSPGIFVIAALTPFGLLVYLGSRGLFPFEQVKVVSDWFSVLARPSPVLYLMPLISGVVILLQHLSLARFRTFGSVCRRLSSFYLVFALLLLLAFAATAPILGDRRQARIESLSDRIVSAPGQTAWPALIADS